MKLLFGFLLVLSMGFFAFMQWGGSLTGTGKNGQALGDLNADKIKLIDTPLVKLLATSAVPPVQLPLPVSAPVAASAPTPVASAPVTAPAIAPPLPASAPVHAPAVAIVATHAPATAPKVAAKTCMEWGEFSGTDLKRATQALDEMKLGDHLAQRTVEYTSGYWVYVPPLKNKAAVNRKIEQLKALGVEDYFVLHEKPRWLNVISLGVFKTEEAAKNYLASLKKKGVHTAKVGERKSKLKFTVFQLNQIDTEQSSKLSKLQKEYENSELKMVACK